MGFRDGKQPPECRLLWRACLCSLGWGCGLSGRTIWRPAGIGRGGAPSCSSERRCDDCSGSRLIVDDLLARRGEDRTI